MVPVVVLRDGRADGSMRDGHADGSMRSGRADGSMRDVGAACAADMPTGSMRARVSCATSVQHARRACSMRDGRALAGHNIQSPPYGPNDGAKYPALYGQRGHFGRVVLFSVVV